MSSNGVSKNYREALEVNLETCDKWTKMEGLKIAFVYDLIHCNFS